MKKYLPIVIASILVLSGLGAVALPDNQETDTIIESMMFSQPILGEQDGYITVELSEATSYKMTAGEPVLPVVSKVYTFPFGTRIENVEVMFSDVTEQVISKKILPSAGPQYINTELASQGHTQVTPGAVYQSEQVYPENQFSYRTGAGLRGDERVIFLTVHYCPVTYTPADNMISVSEQIMVSIDYTLPSEPVTFMDEYDLLIITIPEFAEMLQPLVDYKNDHETPTILVTLDEIPSVGVDQQEDIKYYIKDAIDTWDVHYVLLVGGGVEEQEIIPVRYAWIPSSPYEDSFPSDLYYADIYNATMGFASWDHDGDGKYCEYDEDLPAVDIYPDVYLARLPCNDVVEVEAVVDKIISFSEHNQVLETIVQIGGDTFPGDPEGIFEGEFANERVLEKLPGYSTTQLWGSTDTLTKPNIINGIHDGADYVDFSGHGSVVSWATHPPEDETTWIPEGIQYTGWLYFHVDFLFNSKKYPVVVLNACSTSKFSKSESSLSWYFVAKPGGGAIATYGASGIGYGSYGSSETDRLFGWMEVHLHEEFYRNGVLGEAWGNCITNYTNTFEMEEGDYKTVVELALFGDPTQALVTGPDPEDITTPLPLFIQIFERIIDRFPHAFPILQRLFGYR